ncbi:hypothetical protein tb265_39950 [Gemmatimonadetes bacterium T265]|nr:hypothetical protein tb265_39950 [Gemmatimonadetes bacterium T265]
MSAPTRARAARGVALVVALGIPVVRAAAQRPALAARVAAAAVAGDGAVTLHYATRAAACGDGRDFVALGRFVSGGGVMGYGWRDTPCVHGPATATLAVRGGAVTGVRVRVGGSSPAASAGRDLGAVGAEEAARYFLSLAERDADAEQAVAAATIADSADAWRPLLALARQAAAPERTRRAALHWLPAAAPPEAVPTFAAIVRDPDERRPVREGAFVVLALAPGGSGVPTLVAAARGERAAGGGDAWVRDRAVFWLGNADDPRARAALRTLAAADSAPEAVRAQAIFTLGHLDRGGDRGEGNAAFLRALYPRLTNGVLRDRTIQSVAQGDDAASRRWLLDLAADAAQPLDARKQALFWAGQRDDDVADLLAEDARLAGPELRRHYTFVLSQRPEDAAVDRLIAIARADADAEVRRQAIFWLGQSRSARARAYLEGLVAR